MFSRPHAPVTAGVVLLASTLVIAIASSEFKTALQIAMIGGATTCVVGIIGAAHSWLRPASHPHRQIANASPHHPTVGTESAPVMTARDWSTPERAVRRRSLLPTS